MNRVIVEKNNYLCGYNFSKKCDCVFSRGEPKEINGKTVYYIFCENNVDFVNDGDLVYCKIDNLPLMVSLLSNTNKIVDIITHDSDYEINEYVFSRLYTPNIRRWWGVNVNYIHPNLKSIPLGIGNPYVLETPREEDFLSATGDRIDGKLLYINHRVETYPDERRQPYELFSTNDWITVEEPEKKGNFRRYMKSLSEHKFMLCPRGNGIDTYRFWECLYMGVIPIVKKCINVDFYADLPILVIENYSDITKEMLETKYSEITSRSWNTEKLICDYWINTIKGNHHES